MTSKQNAAEVLERHFLETRAKILEIAAVLDRIDRAGGTCADDPRNEQLRRGIELLLADGPARAQAVQTLFSRKYNEQWRKEMGI